MSAVGRRIVAEKKTIGFVVEGGEVNVDVELSRPTGESIGLALGMLGIGGSSDKWTARSSEGRILDNRKSLIEEGIAEPARIYLSWRFGRGGADIVKIAEMTGGVERRDLEFKKSKAWTDLKCVLTRTVMAMANLKGGGKIIIGISEGPSKAPVFEGMSKEDFDSYNPDDVASFVNEYAEPSVAVVPLKKTYGGKHYVILDVKEFDEVPIVCKKDGRKLCKNHLRRGSVYHRPKRKVESTDRFEYADMRELVHLAATKQHRLMHQQCDELYDTSSEAVPRAPSPGGDLLGAKYDKEGKGF